MDVKDLTIQLQNLNYSQNKDFFINNYKKCLENIKYIDEKLNEPFKNTGKTIEELFEELETLDENDNSIDNIIKMKNLINALDIQLKGMEIIEHN
jgi:hypothetical protein